MYSYIVSEKGLFKDCFVLLYIWEKSLDFGLLVYDSCLEIVLGVIIFFL